MLSGKAQLGTLKGRAPGEGAEMPGSTMAGGSSYLVEGEARAWLSVR